MDLIDRLLECLAPRVQVEQLLGLIRDLNALERTTDADSFAAAAAFTAQHYTEAGLTESVSGRGGVRHFPADGQTEYHTYTAPIAFRTRRAVCTRIDPDGEREVLGDRLVEPNTAILGTGYTGPQGVTGEIAVVHSLEDLTPERVRGKIVFTPKLHPMSLRSAAIAAGALAIVSSQMERQAPEYVRWHNTWDSQTDGWQPTAQAAAENFPGISLAPSTGAALLTRLAAGPVRLEVVTEGEYFAGNMPAVDCRRRGQLDQEVLLSGHLFEQGAMDNASGVITTLFAAQQLDTACKAIGRPLQRGVRAFHSHECYGVLALHATDPRSLSQTIAHLNVDSVGAADVPLKVGRGLFASPGATNPLFERIAGQVSRRLELPLDWWDEFAINCTILADPALGGIPTNFIDQPNSSWHTSRDRFGTFVFSPAVLTQAALITAVWTGWFALAGSDDARDLIKLGAELYGPRLDSAVDTGIYLEVARRDLASVTLLAPATDRAALGGEIDRQIQKLRAVIAGRERRIEPDGDPAVVTEARALYPRAVIGGPVVEKYFNAADQTRVGFNKWSLVQFRLKAAATGEFSIYDLLRRTLCEHTPHPKHQIDLAFAVDFFKTLAKAGLVTLHEKPSTR